MRIILFANTDWFLYNFKLPLANALKCAGHDVILLSPHGAFGEKLRALGFRWEAFELSRSGTNPLSEWQTLMHLRKLYKQIQPDLVHHFTIKCVIYGSFAARKASVKKVVNSITGLGFALLANTAKARLIRPVVVGLYRLALKNTYVIFQNTDNLSTLKNLQVLKSSRVFVIPGDGVDTQLFCPPKHEPAQPCVLMVGRLLWSKGVEDYVKAAALVHQERTEVRFLLAGAQDPGNPENIDDATLMSWQQKGDVIFLGQRHDMLALQQSCSVAVLASKEGEGMPRALLEAASCGRVLVATNVPGSRELVTEGENGQLVPPSNAPALAKAILNILSNPTEAKKMGLRARERVINEFSDARIIAQTLEVYNAFHDDLNN